MFFIFWIRLLKLYDTPLIFLLQSGRSLPAGYPVIIYLQPNLSIIPPVYIFNIIMLDPEQV
ncbi:hypothetical protein [Cytobacillus oceanisediminis]|uniref:hypothetical protein n=1 Tax=Cytobacillus oceanisediminis TaxID=665099 RepID=UPI001C233AB3|nr:hypothetical protein [Cytobacillus oceanisediminis]MBU8772868.1 hypothetical protein [Cytobacillus oceanisediminis]